MISIKPNIVVDQQPLDNKLMTSPPEIVIDPVVKEILKMNKYTVIKVIGAGSSEGKAILVRKIDNEEMFVIKQRNFSNIEQANDGLSEAMFLAKLQNKNVVKFEEVFIVNNGTHGYSLCIVMEYCEGGDLCEFMINLILAGSSSPSIDTTVQDSLILDDIEESEDEEYLVTASSASTNESSNSSCTTTSTMSTFSGSNFSSYSSTPSLPTISFKDISKLNISPKQHSLTHSGLYEQQKAYQLQLLDRKQDDKVDPPPQKKKSSSWYKRKSKDQKEMSVANIEQQFAPPLSPTINYGNKQARILMPSKVLYNWIYQLCLGVHHIHNSHYIHRDLKSENIFLSQYQIKIGDFGLATKFHESNVNGIAGTYYYTSPEILNNQPYCRPADIFSLGCIFYEMATLHLLPLTKRCIAEELISGQFDSLSFKKEFPLEHCELADLVIKMLDENPECRPSIELILQHKIFDVFKIPKSFEIAETSTTSVSTISTFSISPLGGFRKQLERADLLGASELLAEAYEKDPRFSWISKKDKVKAANIRKLFFFNGLKIMFDERFLVWGYHNSDNILNGVACWMTPDCRKRVPFKNIFLKMIKLLPKFGLVNSKKIKDLMNKVDKIMEKSHTSNDNYYHLAYCAVSKESRSKGIGHYMLAPVLEWCDFSNRVCKALVFKQRSIPFFQKMGFEVAIEIKDGDEELPKGLSAVWIMERKPRLKNF